MKKILTALSIFCSVVMMAQPKLSKDNIDEVIKSMTLEEKAELLVGGGWGDMKPGVITGFNTKFVPGAAGWTRSIPRLGIPCTIFADGPAGLRISATRENDSKTYYCTGFPVGTSLASTWNTAVVEEFTKAMGNEVKEYGVDVLLAPGMNIHRNPLCGRNFEYFSEDPIVSGKIAAAYINGIQSNGVGVSAKHFVANNQETERLINDSRINPRTLREIYLKGFEIAVKESNPWTIMSSYNQMNGVYTQEDKELLTDILRDEWKYQGLVITDWTDIRNTKAQLEAGNDLMEPGVARQYDAVIDLVKSGQLSMKYVDQSVKRILEYIVKTPRFAQYKFSNSPDLKGHAKLVRELTPETFVLLENNGALPMKNVKNVALYGNASYDFIAGGTGSANVNKAYVRNVEEGLQVDGFNVNTKISEWYKQYLAYSKTTMNYSGKKPKILLGEPVIEEMSIPVSFIKKMAAESDIAVFTIGRNAGEGRDRLAEDGDWTLSTTERQLMQDLADAYHAVGKKLIVVLNVGGTIETQSWKHIPDAVLLAWAPGQEGGYAIADVLCGKSYPSGKLPMTFPKNYLDIPSSWNFPYDYKGKSSTNAAAYADKNKKDLVRNIDYTDYVEGLYVGYRYFVSANKPVSYPFGYGLSYTQFEFGKSELKSTKDGFVVRVNVKNVGSTVGKEVVEIYVSAPAGGLEKPAYELKGFAKTKELAPGESQFVEIPVSNYDLASFNEATSQWESAKGEYKVMVAKDANTILKTLKYNLKKEMTWKANKVKLLDKPFKEMSLK